MFKNNRGFTLIEMLIVLMIISVLIMLIVPNLSGKTKEVNDKGCDALVSVVQTQVDRSEEHTSELQSRFDLVCRLLLEKKKVQEKDIKRWQQLKDQTVVKREIHTLRS